MSWFDPSAPLDNNGDIETQRLLIENLLKRANAIRATTPHGVGSVHDDMTGGPFPHYIMPVGRLTQQLIDPIVASVHESRALDQLKELAARQSEMSDKAVASLPLTDKGDVDMANKGALLKWAVEASKAQNPALNHVLSAVVRGATTTDHPLVQIGGGRGMVDPDTGEVTMLPEISDQIQKEKEAERAAKMADQKAIIDYKAQVAPTKQVDPVLQQIREKQLEKLNMEVGRKSEGRPLTQATEKEVMGLSEDLSNAKRLYSDFKDDYAGGITKSAERALGNTLGASAGLLDKKAPELAQWWQDYELFKNIPERFAKFGASLTTTEKQAWENATVNPRMDPTVIRNKLSTQMDILKNKTLAVRQSQKEGGANIGQIDAYLKQFGLLKERPKGRNLMENTEIREEDLQPGDVLGGAIWDGKQFVQPDEYNATDLDLGSQTISSTDRRFKIKSVK